MQQLDIAGSAGWRVEAVEVEELGVGEEVQVAVADADVNVVVGGDGIEVGDVLRHVRCATPMVGRRHTALLRGDGFVRGIGDCVMVCVGEWIGMPGAIDCFVRPLAVEPSRRVGDAQWVMEYSTQPPHSSTLYTTAAARVLLPSRRCVYAKEKRLRGVEKLGKR